MNHLERDDDALRWLLTICPAGPRIEFGVCQGRTLAIIADHPDLTVGVDSFEGMGESGPRDRLPDGSDPYPKGRLASPAHVAAAAAPGTTLICGWVPEVFETWLSPPGMLSGGFAFAHVDLDHYEPTKATLKWLWDEMLPGGIICCDDWFWKRDYLAAGAIHEVAAIHPLMGCHSQKCWWIR